ncbi:MAG: glycyl-radical enzyme activating protein [Proteobacteria bacterium]|nr:glycyl-radical enzyme activating protein [Pseudomonadota bacterium]
MENEVLITNIQKFAVNDGPGIRTNVFIKGCPLRCEWCHNPETLHPYREIFYKKRMCVQCGACLEVCPEDAIQPPVPPEVAQAEDSTYYKIIRDKCTLCMDCVEACKFTALEISGKPMTPQEILDEVEQDRPFYDNSGGGMTLSGGEPTAYPDFAQAILKEAKKRGIHVCLDTSGFCEWKVLEDLLGDVDIVLFDFKHVDVDRHREKTGVSNEKILDNLAKITQAGLETWVRIPIIPGYNDSMEFHAKAADFLAGLPGKIERLDLIPYHNYCQQEYGWLGLEWSLKDVMPMEPSFLEVPAEVYRERGLKTTIGGSGFEQ